MAISRVGNLIAGAAKNGANVTLTFSTTPAANDVVYVFGGHHTAGGAGSGYGPTAASGYTEVKAPDTTGAFGFGVWRKVLTGADASVVCLGNGAAADVAAYAAAVYTGENTTTPEDVAIPAYATGTAADFPDCPSIDPVTNDCAIVIAAMNDKGDTSPGTPTNYNTPVGASIADTSGTLQIYISDRILSGSAAEDPSAFSTWLTNALWKAITVAVRPFVPVAFQWYPMDFSRQDVPNSLERMIGY